MEWHPFAEKFPLLEGAEWESFKASIQKTGGNKVPVIYRKAKGKKQGIDGRNRFRACEELGLRCKMEEEILEDDEVKDYIIVRNIDRRHMTRELRQTLVADLRADGKSEREIADTLKVSQMTVHRDLQVTETNDSVKTITGRDGRQQPSTKPVTETNVAVLFDVAAFDSDFGKVIGHIDKLGEVYQRTKAEIKTMADALEHWRKQFREWHKRLKEGSKTPLPPPSNGFLLPNLNTPAFIEAWDKWLRHRKEKGATLKPESMASQLKKFAEWGPKRSIAAIEYTIFKGWQGLREPDPRDAPKDFFAGLKEFAKGDDS